MTYKSSVNLHTKRFSGCASLIDFGNSTCFSKSLNKSYSFSALDPFLEDPLVVRSFPFFNVTTKKLPTQSPESSHRSTPVHPSVTRGIHGRNLYCRRVVLASDTTCPKVPLSFFVLALYLHTYLSFPVTKNIRPQEDDWVSVEGQGWGR